MSETPRVWIGCLACYNAGRLVGEWYDATEAADLTPKDVHERAITGCDVATFELHEELWVMDHEGFGGFLAGECSPSEAQDIAEVIASIPDYIEVEAVAAYVENFGVEIAEFDLSDFEESFNGKWSDREEFAEQLADDIGAIDSDAGWPNSYIDWERAARDLFMGDYWDAPAPGGDIYVFRAF